MHLVKQELELALHLPVLESMALLQLHGRQVVFEQVLEQLVQKKLRLQNLLVLSVAELEPLPPVDFGSLRTHPALKY
jgi:hypothetical protein